jgi:hypothetical protein
MRDDDEGFVSPVEAYRNPVFIFLGHCLTPVVGVVGLAQKRATTDFDVG